MKRKIISRSCLVWLALLATLLSPRTGMVWAADSQTPPPDAKFPYDQRKPPAVPLARAVPLDKTLRASATKEIEADLKSPDAIMRARALEAAGQTLGSAAQNEIIAALADKEPIVRFSAAMAAGRMPLAPARDALLKLKDDPDHSVQVGALFALHRLGDKQFSHRLETLSIDASPDVRGRTALAMGLLDEPSAIKVLLPMLQDKQENLMVELQAAEGLWRLHNPDGLQLLVANTLSGEPDNQVMALEALAGPKDLRAAIHLRSALMAELPEAELTAAKGLGQLGSDEGYGVALTFAKSKEPRQRSMAALAFGAIARSDAQDVLADLLKDSTPPVRLSAALAILQLHK